MNAWKVEGPVVQAINRAVNLHKDLDDLHRGLCRVGLNQLGEEVQAHQQAVKALQESLWEALTALDEETQKGA